jgi:hypothetical protein
MVRQVVDRVLEECGVNATGPVVVATGDIAMLMVFYFGWRT